VIITDISRQVKNPNRYNVFVDGEFAFGITDADLLAHRLHKGMEVDTALLDKLQNELEFARARDSAVVYLSRAPKSAKEIARKLAEKEFSPVSIARVMGLLTKNGYIDDTAFAEQLIRHRYNTSGHGKKRIVGELVQKGVSKQDIIAAFNLVFDEDEAYAEIDASADAEFAAATMALEKKLRSRDIDDIADDPKEIQRLVAFLARRGFTYDVIKRVMTRLLEE